MYPSHLPVKLKFHCQLQTFIHLPKIKTFDRVIKYLNTLFVSDIHLYHLLYACEFDSSAHMRCIRFLSKIGCDNELGVGGEEVVAQRQVQHEPSKA
jgi:hypothetical protein